MSRPKKTPSFKNLLATSKNFPFLPEITTENTKLIKSWLVMEINYAVVSVSLCTLWAAVWQVRIQLSHRRCNNRCCRNLSGYVEHVTII